MSGFAVCGMNGAGKSSAAKALADLLDFRLLDIEDYYFPPADPPFSIQRDKEEITRLLRHDALPGNFIFASVSPDGYGIDYLISAVFRIEVPAEIRIPRIRKRDILRYGERVLAGGDMHENCEAFIKKCKARDPEERKSRARLPGRPFIELDGEHEISENVKIISEYITKHFELSQ